MIFEHDFFHGDPHPGNLLVLPDGRIGLLDFGLCKGLPPGFARLVAQMMVSARVGDSDASLDAASRATRWPRYETSRKQAMTGRLHCGAAMGTRRARSRCRPPSPSS
jgi:predicted unusual protein kinase regulating ubiquinone biosynthesis (AarF/ABC1/UbiB family)